MIKNNDIDKTHKNLLKLYEQVRNRAKHSKTLEEFDALADEGSEILHRINRLQRCLFVKITKRISKRAEALRKADAELKVKIKSLESVKETIRELTRYLGKVDELIDFAKQIAI